MIIIANGNILDAKENVIGHQVNCQGRMGAGLALQIIDKYPNVYESYLDLCNSRGIPRKMLGHYQIVRVSDHISNDYLSGSGRQRRYVCNLFGQLNYGREKGRRYTSYNALYTALNGLKHWAKTYNRTVALPYNIGCGLAGGDWDTVYGIIQDVFDDYNVTLYKLEQ